MADKSEIAESVEDAAEAETPDSAEEEDLSPGQRCMSCVGLGCLERCANSCPRLHGILFGIVLPLWIMIGVSSLFGYG